MTMVEEDRTQARVDGLLGVLRDAEADFRRSYARVLDVVAELEQEKAGAVAGFGTTARLLAGVLNLSKGEAKTRVEQAGLLTPRRSLTGAGSRCARRPCVEAARVVGLQAVRRAAFVTLVDHAGATAASSSERSTSQSTDTLHRCREANGL